VCGRLFCQEHRGWREARVGRYNVRRPVCLGCNAKAGPGAGVWLFWLLALLALGAGGVAIYWLTVTRW
jgi:hypothetical protein